MAFNGPIHQQVYDHVICLKVCTRDLSGFQFSGCIFNLRSNFCHIDLHNQNNFVHEQNNYVQQKDR